MKTFFPHTSMKKILLAAVVLVIASGVYYAGHMTPKATEPQEVMDEKKPADPRITATWEMTTGQEMQDGQEDPITVSFRCDDNSSFVATFTQSMDEVSIESEGEANTFAKVESPAGKLYASAAWSLLFRGEEVTITDKVSGVTKTCKPPFDPEKAPLNFGD